MNIANFNLLFLLVSQIMQEKTELQDIIPDFKFLA